MTQPKNQAADDENIGHAEHVSLNALQGMHANERIALPIIEETLDISKVEVDRGGYRITKHVEVQPHLVDEVLRHERVAVERRPVGRVLAEGELPKARYEGDTLIIPVIEEVIVTQKQMVFVEEVYVTQSRGTHRDPQCVELRKENIEIERLGASNKVIRSS